MRRQRGNRRDVDDLDNHPDHLDERPGDHDPSFARTGRYGTGDPTQPASPAVPGAGSPAAPAPEKRRDHPARDTHRPAR
ncbi:hypothetical protein [Mycolicibacterium baixiangningiae]|uniref:hypothetical protein n=1 Tax=Mycolicibacterium baixiangningiae TaxID=2761578 RepID=UPI0018674CAF|nr:hypothetical protein [Mycolicibacterium baixiangningiae]